MFLSIPLGLLLDVIYMIKVEYMSSEDREQFDADLEDAAASAADQAKARREFASRHGDLTLVKR